MDERRSRGAKKIRNVEKKGEERMRANCRNCKHFIPRYKMTRSQLEEAMICQVLSFSDTVKLIISLLRIMKAPAIDILLSIRSKVR